MLGDGADAGTVAVWDFILGERNAESRVAAPTGRKEARSGEGVWVGVATEAGGDVTVC